MVVLSWDGRGLRMEAAPHGIVSLELARTQERAAQILDAWSRADLIGTAQRNVWIDFGFLLAYPVAISLLCALLADRIDGFRPLGAGAAWLALLMTPLDFIENVALLRMLDGEAGSSWPAISFWCAAPKFGILAACVGFVALGSTALLVRRSRAS